jgi:hypothetical protein
MSRTLDLNKVSKAQRAKRKWQLLQEELKQERKAKHIRRNSPLSKTN